MSASRIVAASALWLANSDTAHAAVNVNDPSKTDETVEHIEAAIEALERARLALRGF